MGEIVPKHGRVISATKMRRRVSLLGVDKVGELGRVPHFSLSAFDRAVQQRKPTEEHGCVVRHKVPVALGCFKLDSEAPWVSVDWCQDLISKRVIWDTHRTRSCEPLSPPTVEKRTVMGHFAPV